MAKQEIEKLIAGGRTMLRTGTGEKSKWTVAEKTRRKKALVNINRKEKTPNICEEGERTGLKEKGHPWD